jgi:uncharacterized protein (TIGR02594 family)
MTPYEVAKSLIGTREIHGPKHNPIIVAMLRAYASWVNDDETPWCSAFVNHCAQKAGYEKSGRLDARSWLKVGLPVGHRDDGATVPAEYRAPKEGDVAILWRGSPKSWQGHVAFYVDERDGLLNLLGGNQRDMVRHLVFQKAQLLGIRRLRPITVAK